MVTMDPSFKYNPQQKSVASVTIGDPETDLSAMACSSVML
jgi:hypothetical protein